MLLTTKIMSSITLPLASARNVTEVTRSVLKLMEIHTGLESNYLMQLDSVTGILTVRYAHNSKTLLIPEGMCVEWKDTLCSHALEDPAGFEKKLPELCKKTTVAKTLGIKTLISAPVYYEDGELYGVLCAASRNVVPTTDEAREAIILFSKVISQQVQREILFKQVANTVRKAGGDAFAAIF